MTRDDAKKSFEWTLNDWRTADSDEKLNLIKVLSKETWEEYDLFDAKRALAWAYLTTPNPSKPDEEYREDYRNSLFDWLKICLSSKNTDELYFQTRSLKGKNGHGASPLDRETCIRDLIREGTGLNKLFFGSNGAPFDKEGELHLRFLITWFIRRYDLKTAGWLLQQLKKHRPRAKPETVPPTEGTGSAPWGWGRACQYLVPMLLAAALLLPFLFHDAYRFILPLIYVSLPAGVLWLLTSPQANLAIGLLVPRLAGCIIVGYLPLVVGIETWQAIGYLAKTPYSWQLYVLIVIAGLAAFGYLIVEMQHINLAKCEVIRRSLKVYTIGLSWSLGIGLVMLDLLGLAYQKMDGNNFLCDTQLTWLPGLLGKIPWEILLGYVPLALLIGIFLQIIWEEKPITEPL